MQKTHTTSYLPLSLSGIDLGSNPTLPLTDTSCRKLLLEFEARTVLVILSFSKPTTCLRLGNDLVCHNVKEKRKVNDSLK